MVRKTKSAQTGYVRVIFELPAFLWADRIFVVGEFNDWDQRSLPMTQDRRGVWRLELDLSVGQRYEYLYLVKGCWLTDSYADTIVPNAFGSLNSVITLESDPLPL